MAGSFSDHFKAKQAQYQAAIDAAAVATPKLAATNTALAILDKATITQAEAEQLFNLQQAAD